MFVPLIKCGGMEVNMTAKEMAKTAYKALEEKKAEDIRILDISGISTVAD